MRNIEADNRARSLQLNPRPRQTNRKCHIVIEPRMSDEDCVKMDRMRAFAQVREDLQRGR